MRQILVFFFSIQLASAGLIPAFENANSIYGKDDRIFVDQQIDFKIAELSNSIGLIVNKDTIEKNSLHSLIKGNLLSDKDELNVCKGEKFSDHHSLNSCTGFLIAEDLVVSAGHCFVDEFDCSTKNIIFNVQSKNELIAGYEVLNSSIYECSEIVKSVYDPDNGQDFAIIRLKQKVEGRKPLKLRSKGKINLKDQVFMIGHPLGLPMILTGNAKILNTSLEHLFYVALDSFEGNSGAPVFNSKSLEVEGILVNGADDFIQDPSLDCYHYQTYNDGSLKTPAISGEGVTRISDILNYL